jgi:L-ascorbate metabolism protein UlaG (beta-lactamase superfamily)
MSSRGRSELFRDPFPTGRWIGGKSDHFDGRRFVNLDPTAHGKLRDFLKWTANRAAGVWKRVDQAPGPRPAERVERGIRVTLVGHATTLVQMDGFNILTDPVWADRVSPVSFAGPRRFRPPAIRYEDLPPIDLIVVSHDHYDHLCAPTLKRLARDHAPKVASGLGNAALLESLGVRAPIELDWWESAEIAPGLRATFVPAQHFSGRGVRDRDTTLWGGFVIEGPSGKVFFAGDTGMGPHFEMIRERCGTPRLALLPIGAYRPVWFMSRVHIAPHEAVAAAKILGASTSVAIHYGSFRLADDGMEEPITDLEAALAREGEVAPRFWVLDHGVGRDVPESSAARISAAASPDDA